MVVGTGVSGEVGGEGRRGVGRGNHDQSRLAEQRRGLDGGARAGGADDADYVPFGDDGLSGSASALSRAHGVQRFSEVDLAAVDVAVVLGGQLEAVPQPDGKTGDDGVREQRTDLDGLVSADFDRAERSGLEAGGFHIRPRLRQTGHGGTEGHAAADLLAGRLAR